MDQVSFSAGPLLTPFGPNWDLKGKGLLYLLSRHQGEGTDTKPEPEPVALLSPCPGGWGQAPWPGKEMPRAVLSNGLWAGGGRVKEYAGLGL